MALGTLVWVLIGLIALIIVIFIVYYNRFTILNNRIDNSLAQIDVQLRKRADLIPNLISTVKGYAQHERELFEKVTQARANAIGAQGMKERASAENALSDTLKSLFAVSENYPDLKASVNFLELQKELADTEDKIQAARRFYNTNVMELNTKIESFPTNIFASAFSFKQMELFEIAEASQREAVKVKF